MSDRPVLLFPDTTALISLHLCGHLAQVANIVAALGGEGRWAASVERECAYRDKRTWPGLYAAASPIFPTIEYPTAAEMLNVKAICDRMAKPDDKDNANVGEAETITIIESRLNVHQALLVTDDHGAYKMARARKIVVYGTLDVLDIAVAKGWITEAAQATAVAVMNAQDRHPRRWRKPR